MNYLTAVVRSFGHLLYPNLCDGCGNELSGKSSRLCIRCIHELPLSGFEYLPGNPVEKRFYGRLPLENASAAFYFNKASLIQELVHQLKYKGNRNVGWQLGELMGLTLKDAGRVNPDLIIPLPLNPARERKRGYNQSKVLCEGIVRQFPVVIREDIVSRPFKADSQTRKGRVERWQNISGKFVVNEHAAVHEKHILLVDDVITTGATLEECGAAIKKVFDCRLSVACLCYASR
jgi:ComF family protein